VTVVGIIIELLLWFFIVLLLARIVADWVQMFARSWTPRGPILVVLEVTYSLTDPPIRALRKIIPPLRLGGISLDLSILVVLLMAIILRAVNREFVLFA
jgi:YggT family protein